VLVVRNIVFFKSVRSAIAFHQMVGRGTRIHEPTGKLMFTVYDYTDATRLFGEEFISRAVVEREPKEGPEPPPAPERQILVQGFEVRVTETPARAPSARTLSRTSTPAGSPDCRNPAPPPSRRYTERHNL